MPELLGKNKKIYYDGALVGYTRNDSVSRKTNTSNILHKTNAGSGSAPGIEAVRAKSYTVTFSLDAYYLDAGDCKTLHMAQFADEDNAIALKSIASGGDTETYSQSCILNVDDDHPVDDYSTFKVSIQAFGTRTLSTVA
jgi:hypothetical protein